MHVLFDRAEAAGGGQLLDIVTCARGQAVDIGLVGGGGGVGEEARDVEGAVGGDAEGAENADKEGLGVLGEDLVGSALIQLAGNG